MFLLYARFRALIYRRIRRHKNPPPKAAMEAREFIHVRLQFARRERILKGESPKHAR